jgi:hypothetical protein
MSGRILIDGRDTRGLTLKSLRDHISIVPQEPLLFSGTIADNIRYGRLEATMDEVVAAATAANAHDFIARLSDGYETQIGERGVRLSGGERQRLCVARAVSEERDDSDSRRADRLHRFAYGGCDPRRARLADGRSNDVHDRASVCRRCGTRTPFSSMDGGAIVEQGSHDELLARGGLYAQLHAVQTSQRERRRPELIASARESRMTRAPIVVLGAMTRYPVGRHHLADAPCTCSAFRRLGYDCYYVESHGGTPRPFVNDGDDGSAGAAAFLARLMDRFDLSDRWAFMRCMAMAAATGLSALGTIAPLLVGRVDCESPWRHEAARRACSHGSSGVRRAPIRSCSKFS